MDDNKGKQSKSSLFNNWLSYLGFGISVIFIIGETLIIGMDLLRGGGNLYAGVLIYIVGPGILTTGLVMVPFCMWLEHRKRMRGEPSSHMPVLDLGNPQHRIKILIFIAVTISFVIISMVGSYQAYHLTESNQFCGLLCHQVIGSGLCRLSTFPPCPRELCPMSHWRRSRLVCEKQDFRRAPGLCSTDEIL